MEVAQQCVGYKLSDKEIPKIKYNANENKVWSTIYEKLTEIYKTHACKEYNESLAELRKHAGFTANEVP